MTLLILFGHKIGHLELKNEILETDVNFQMCAIAGSEEDNNLQKCAHTWMCCNSSCDDESDVSKHVERGFLKLVTLWHNLSIENLKGLAAL